MYLGQFTRISINFGRLIPLSISKGSIHFKQKTKLCMDWLQKNL